MNLRNLVQQRVSQDTMRYTNHERRVRSHCTLSLSAGVLLALVLGCGTAEGQELEGPVPAKQHNKVIYLQPLGRELSSEAIHLVEKALQQFYGLEVKRAAPVALPRQAFYPPRKRYRAEKLLNFMEQNLPADSYRVLGVTAVDISTTKGRIRDWGIMGLATLDGRVSVMSMFRCRRGSKNIQHAQERLGKVAVHEIGHTFGLAHCPTYGCLMEDARGTNVTTDREYVLCSRCRAFLSKRGFQLPPDPHPPWSRPTKLPSSTQ